MASNFIQLFLLGNYWFLSLGKVLSLRPGLIQLGGGKY